MFEKMKLKNLNMLSFLIMGLVPVLVVGLLALLFSRRELRAHITAHLESIRDIKKSQIESFFSERLNDTLVLADNPFVRQAFKDLDAALKAGGGFAGGKFQGYTNGRYDAPAEYKAVHDKYFPTLRYYMEQYGYRDLFFLCGDHGDISFTVVKESDFGQRATEIDSGSLGDAWRVAAKEDKACISDVKSYTPSADEPAQFIAAPIKDDGEIIGVVALQISMDEINRIMSERSGMGRTGETYLIGPDCLMRSDSFLEPVGHSVVASFAGTVEKNGIDTEASHQALAGKSGTEIITDYRGNLALSAYAPVKVGDITWVLLAEIDKSEAFAPITTLTWVVAITVGVTIVAVILISMLISRLLSRKLNSEMSQLQTASSQLKSASQQQLISATEQNAITGQVSATMNELAVTAKQVSERCLQVSHQAANATICCKDGGQAVQQAQMVMKEIKGHIGKIVQHMLDLGQKSQQINLAVEIITELSEQTTILSYNAAIEAASAGDANQGFAVVAEQVGKLAERAKEATRDVRNMIEEIQKATNTTVMATEDSIKAAEHGLEAQDEANKKMNQIAEEIQATLDSVREIEMSSKQQTTATEQVKEGVSNIVSAVKETEASSKQTQATADQLVTTAVNLRNI